MTLDAETAFEFLIPLVVVVGVAFAWDAWNRPAAPPRFHPYAVRQGWQVDPLAFLDRDLRAGRLTTAILTVRDDLTRELVQRHGLTRAEIRAHSRHLGTPSDPLIDRACRAVLSLERTYLLAARVEDPQRTDLWSRWRRPAWRARARDEFDAELAEATALRSAFEEPG
jgi:hypothetical protein